MAQSSTTTIQREAFGTMAEALAFIQEHAGIGGGATIQLLVGSNAWPDLPRRYRVTLISDNDTRGTVWVRPV